MGGVIKRTSEWAGLPGAILGALVAIGLIGSAGTMWIGAPMSSVPFFDLLAFPLVPFPTLACYAAAGLLAFVLLRPAFGLLIGKGSGAHWAAGVLAVLVVTTIGFTLPKSWNAAAGLTTSPVQEPPHAVSLIKGSDVALIERGEPAFVRCGALCLSLLLQGQAQAVDVAATLREPAPLAALPGKRFMLKAQTRRCLSGMRDYALPTSSAEERHKEFRDGVPTEYDTCLDGREQTVDPARQTTLVEWTGALTADTRKLGYSGPVSVVRTVVPIEGHAPLIHEARYRSGWKYNEPLFIWPYAGNAGSGSFFSPSISTSYFLEPGFPDELSPRFWRLLQGSELMGQRTAAWLDTVVARGTFLNPDFR